MVLSHLGLALDLDKCGLLCLQFLSSSFAFGNCLLDNCFTCLFFRINLTFFFSNFGLNFCNSILKLFDLVLPLNHLLSRLLLGLFNLVLPEIDCRQAVLDLLLELPDLFLGLINLSLLNQNLRPHLVQFLCCLFLFLQNHF